MMLAPFFYSSVSSLQYVHSTAAISSNSSAPLPAPHAITNHRFGRGLVLARSLALGGFLIIPMIPYLLIYMPETVPQSRRKPIALSGFTDAITSQVSRALCANVILDIIHPS